MHCAGRVTRAHRQLDKRNVRPRMDTLRPAWDPVRLLNVFCKAPCARLASSGASSDSSLRVVSGGRAD
eukprot:scaffold630_cov399-Prasinococcus_capsulatus_cf.AAC.29